MLTLLFAVVVCGIVAWVIQSLNMPQPFRTISFAVLILIVVIIFFRVVLGVSSPFPVR